MQAHVKGQRYFWLFSRRRKDGQRKGSGAAKGNMDGEHCARLVQPETVARGLCGMLVWKGGGLAEGRLQTSASLNFSVCESITRPQRRRLYGLPSHGLLLSLTHDCPALLSKARGHFWWLNWLPGTAECNAIWCAPTARTHHLQGGTIVEDRNRGADRGGKMHSYGA